MRNRYVLCFVLNVFALTGCGAENENTKAPARDTATSGKIQISVDESYKPPISSLVDVFMMEYPKTKIEASYVASEQAVLDLMTNKARAILVPRELKSEESEAFKKASIIPKVVKLADDAIALIAHPSQGDLTLTVKELEGIFTGGTKSWSELGEGSGPIRVVFDNANSSAVQYITDRFCKNGKLPENAFATQKTEEVIQYVAKNPGTLGIIGVSWISDLKDPKNQKFFKEINVVAVGEKEGSEFFKPFQYYIALRQYPLSRTLYMLIRESYHGLAHGFSNFAAGQRGQLLFLKAGLLPAYAQIRLMKFKNEPFKVQ